MSKYAMLARMFGNPHMALRVVTRYDSFIVRQIMHSSTLKSKYLEYLVDANVGPTPTNSRKVRALLAQSICVTKEHQ